MIVGAALIELHVHGSHSLKEKRGVVRSVLGRIRSRFNVSAAEVDGQDTWQRAVLGVVTVGHDARTVRSVLDRVVAFTEGVGLAEVTNSDVEVLNLEHGDGSGLAEDDDLEEEPGAGLEEEPGAGLDEEDERDDEGGEGSS